MMKKLDGEHGILQQQIDELKGRLTRLETLTYILVGAVLGVQVASKLL